MRTALLLPVALLLGCSPVPTSTPVTTPGKAAKVEYPYPECEAFIRKVKAESGEPEKVEIVEWRGRRPGEKPGWFMIVARVRDVNKFGAREVGERHIEIGPKD